MHGPGRPACAWRKQLILLDTSGLLAALNASRRQHAPCCAALPVET
jgi:hypothetical protein